MKIGDRLKIKEKLPHSKENEIKTTLGEIVQIDKFKVTIVQLQNGIKTFNSSYNIADFKDKNKSFELDEGEGFKKIKIIVSEPKII